jgi:hypothetical protein
MIRTAGIVLLILSASFAVAQETDQPPALTGFVTRVISHSVFYVNGIRVVCGQDTSSGRADTHIYQLGCPKPPAFVGEQMNIYGRLYRKQATVDAATIQMVPVSLGKVSGSAVIDAPPRHTAAGLMVRADGYWILIEGKTAVKFEGALHGLAAIQPNVWMEYKARVSPDGMLVASKVRIRPNSFTPREEKYNRKLKKVDPAKVSKNKAQSNASAAIIGLRLKKIPAWTDPQMQARISAIGEGLVPDYQKQLPNSDPSKLHFRFIVVGGTLENCFLPLPDGTILIGHNIVQRLKSDSLIAALLSFEIAAVLDHETYRMAALETTVVSAGSASLMTAELLNPGVGLALFAGSHAAQSAIDRKVFAQCARVGLQLMHNGGYDLNDALPAWWLLCSTRSKPIAEIPLNPYLASLGHILAEVWHNPSWPATGHPSAPIQSAGAS